MNGSLEEVCPIHDKCQVVLVITDILWFPRLTLLSVIFKFLLAGFSF